MADDGSNESSGITEFATTGDTNSIFTEPTGDKLLVTLSNNWPSADTADALTANGANCAAGQAPLGVDASGAVESCFDVWTEAENTSAGYISATLTEEEVEDYVGGMLGGTETGISVTYQDATNDIDFVVDHDTASNFVANEHIDWTADQGATNIHAGNYTDTTCDGGSCTITNAGTAASLAANGANCAAGSYPLGVGADGAVESCTDATTEINTEIGNVLDGTDAFTDFNGAVIDSDNYVADSIDDTHINWGTGAGQVSTDDVTEGTNKFEGTTAGDYLTLTGEDIDLDVEIYTDVKCLYWEDPTADDDFTSVWTSNGFASTITKIWCESDQTVNLDLQVDDGTPADVDGTDLVCDSTPAEDESMGGDATLADGDRLDVAVTSVSGTPTWVSVCFTYTKDD